MAWTGSEVDQRALKIRTRVAHRAVRTGSMEGLDALEMILFPSAGLLKASEQAAVEELDALEESRRIREGVKT